MSPPNANVSFRKSLVFRLAATIFVLLVVFSVVQQAFTERALQAAIVEHRVREAYVKVQSFAEELNEHLSPEIKEAPTLGLLVNFARLNPGIILFITDKNGKVILSSLPGLEVSPFSYEALRKFEKTDVEFPQYTTDPRLPSRTLPYVAAMLSVANSKGYLVLLLEENGLESRDVKRENTAQSTGRKVLLNFIFACATTILIALLLLRVLTNRLAALTREVSAYKPGKNLSIEGGVDEIGVLAKAFSKMSETIAAEISQLNERDALRRELVAGISHDLRTPLSSIKGYLQKLAEQISSGKISEGRTKDFLEVLQRNTERLDELVNSLFELSKFDALQEHLNRSIFSVNTLLSRLVERFEPAARAADVALLLSASSNVDVNADESLLERAISNIIDNAIRYTGKDGNVTISITPKDSEIEIEIKDTGEGIPPEKLSRIFDKFYRGDSARSDRGAGLGLAIAQRIVDAHGGHIKVESEVGIGTIFLVSLPRLI